MSDAQPGSIALRLAYGAKAGQPSSSCDWLPMEGSHAVAVGETLGEGVGDTLGEALGDRVVGEALGDALGEAVGEALGEAVGGGSGGNDGGLSGGDVGGAEGGAEGIGGAGSHRSNEPSASTMLALSHAAGTATGSVWLQ